eukprot:TRINITY_DN67258_c6_g1_i1.p1 TRINITY_DN67258_c6_g1~~TRINITY_DN67258_c6_g1_i1.p1  ORF type:complete len:746 (-),score=76.85 TRINITY_DN67258_c6_g1_i1:65-2035(-)
MHGVIRSYNFFDKQVVVVTEYGGIKHCFVDGSKKPGCPRPLVETVDTPPPSTFLSLPTPQDDIRQLSSDWFAIACSMPQLEKAEAIGDPGCIEGMSQHCRFVLDVREGNTVNKVPIFMKVAADRWRDDDLAAAFVRESFVYKFLGGNRLNQNVWSLPLLPAVFHADVDLSTPKVVLVLEDVSIGGECPFKSTQYCNLQQDTQQPHLLYKFVGTLGTFHREALDSYRVENVTQLLLEGDDRASAVVNFDPQEWRSALAFWVSHFDTPALTPETVQRLQKINLPALIDKMRRMRSSLLHGDIRPEHIYWQQKNEQFMLVDWKGCKPGPPVLDFVKFLVTVLSPSQIEEMSVMLWNKFNSDLNEADAYGSYSSDCDAPQWDEFACGIVYSLISTLIDRWKTNVKIQQILHPPVPKKPRANSLPRTPPLLPQLAVPVDGESPATAPPPVPTHHDGPPAGPTTTNVNTTLNNNNNPATQLPPHLAFMTLNSAQLQSELAKEQEKNISINASIVRITHQQSMTRKHQSRVSTPDSGTTNSSNSEGNHEDELLSISPNASPSKIDIALQMQQRNLDKLHAQAQESDKRLALLKTAQQALKMVEGLVIGLSSRYMRLLDTIDQPNTQPKRHPTQEALTMGDDLLGESPSAAWNDFINDYLNARP